MNAFFNDIAANGIVVDGVAFSTIFVQGGLFSLDGVHPTSQGYAIIANKFIEVIYDNYSADIPMIDVTTIPGSLNLAKKVELSKIGIPYFSPGMFKSIFH